jgi:cyclase
MSNFKRVIASVVSLNRHIVQSFGFERYLPVGSPECIVESLNRYGADEILFSDISSSKGLSQGVDFDLIRSVSNYCHTPMTVAGGISKLSDVEKLMNSGADKVGISSNIFDTDLIKDIVTNFGSQCVVACLDIKDGKIYLKNGKEESSFSLEEGIRFLEDHEVGEILINTISHDGKKCGFDKDSAQKALSLTSLPVIACGGASCPDHFFELFSVADVDAAAAGNMFSFTEHSIPLVKTHLSSKGVMVREDTCYKYESSDLSYSGRLLKKGEEYLEDLMYLPPVKEDV